MHAEKPTDTPVRLVSPRFVAGVDRAPLVGAIGLALVAALLASLFGFLDEAKHHPDVKLAGSMFLSLLGVGVVWLLRPLMNRQDGGEAIDHDRPSLRSVIALWLALLSMAAALIHFAVIEQHWAEYWLYGAFFIAIGLFQVAWSFVVVLRPSQFVYLAGALVNGATIAAWVVTRTVGSFVGPAAHQTEMIGFGDVVSTVFEVLIVIGSVALLARTVNGRGRVAVRRRTADHLVNFAALATAMVTILGMFSSVGGSPFVSHVG